MRARRMRMRARARTTARAGHASRRLDDIERACMHEIDLCLNGRSEQARVGGIEYPAQNESCSILNASRHVLPRLIPW